MYYIYIYIYIFAFINLSVLSIFGYERKTKVIRYWRLSFTNGTIPALTRFATDPSFRLTSRQLPGGDLDPVWTGMANCSIFAPGAKLSSSNCERLQNMFI
jgi:hypothetical protein